MPTKQRTNPVYTVSEFASRLEEYSEEERARILKAADVSKKLHSGQYRDSGEPFFVHPLQVADILRSLRMDPDTLIAALLHDVLEDTKITRQELRRDYGRDVEALVNGVTKIALVKSKNKSVQEAQTIRKMLLAMVKDIRVILIKLADKLHNMRTLEFKEAERRRDIAQECLDIYAPLASRLGIAWIKDELEDLSLKNLHPDSYDYIRRFVTEKRDERSDYLERVRRTLDTTIEKAGLDVTVETRAKHFYSIYQKMKKRGKAIDEIYDLLGIRIVCDTEADCYYALGLVHGLWPPIEGRFKDYIAMPKANQYQSLHTTVLSFGGKMIEIQIRTREMHETAEFGVAAHWFYKRVALPEQQRREDLSILTKVKDLGGMRVTSSEFLDEIKREILKDSIYVFTPQGDAIQLPRGSTAIDFAYHIHTEVGNHTNGAKADGQIIPLKAELSNTQVIEILTSPNAHPHLNWLRYVRTSRARQKIRQWLNKHDENLIIDRSIVARRETGHPHHQQLTPKEPQHSRRILDKTKVGVRIGDERNMMIRFAGCCSPTTGDEIVGYVSRGRGIIVHRRDCKNVQKIEDFQERRIEVEWETVSPKATRRFRVVARKTLDLFSEIEGAVKKYHGHLIEGRVDENDNGRLEATFTMELERRDDFKRVMKAIRTVPSVLSINESTERVSAPG